MSGSSCWCKLSFNTVYVQPFLDCAWGRHVIAQPDSSTFSRVVTRAVNYWQLMWWSIDQTEICVWPVDGLEVFLLIKCRLHTGTCTVGLQVILVVLRLYPDNQNRVSTVQPTRHFPDSPVSWRYSASKNTIGTLNCRDIRLLSRPCSFEYR